MEASKKAPKWGESSAEGDAPRSNSSCARPGAETRAKTPRKADERNPHLSDASCGVRGRHGWGAVIYRGGSPPRPELFAARRFSEVGGRRIWTPSRVKPAERTGFHWARAWVGRGLGLRRMADEDAAAEFLQAGAMMNLVMRLAASDPREPASASARSPSSRVAVAGGETGRLLPLVPPPRPPSSSCFPRRLRVGASAVFSRPILPMGWGRAGRPAVHLDSGLRIL